MRMQWVSAKSTCRAVWVALAWMTLGWLPGQAAPPNVLVFIADDAGWGDYSIQGNRQVDTPHIDSIAKHGVRFERFYVCPVCSPTRAEFLTGRYHPRCGVYGVSTGQERMDLAEKTVADCFRAAGYVTGLFGKWHNGSQWPYHPNARGFEEFFGYTAGHWGQYFDPPLEHNGQPVRCRGYIVDIITDEAIRFIETHQHRPFFCCIAFTTPHSPWAVPSEYWQRFQNKPITQRATEPQREDIDQTRCVLAMMENQDWNVGRVLDKLRSLGLHDNTIILYFSDNGPNGARWTGGLRGTKGSTDEGGVRSVLFLQWPARIRAGRTVPHIAGAIDLLPTLLALTNVPRVGSLPLDGRDLSPLLLADDLPEQWPDRLIFSTWMGRVSVTNQQFRLDHQGRLYDLLTDPGQTTPVNDRYPDVASRLKAEVARWAAEVLPQSRPPLRPGNVDPRPLPVGFPEFPRTWLPARDGQPIGGIRRSSSAPNSSYFVNWTSTEDAIVWDIEVHTAGKYLVEISYTCPESDAGSEIELRFAGSRLRGRVTPGWDPPLFDNQDTLPRPAAESPMKEFRTLQLGEITLPRAQGPLTLQAISIPGKQVMHLLDLTLTLLPDGN
jgi:arylsulfatase A-like enzyme